MGQHLGGGKQQGGLHIFHPPLAAGVKQAHGVNLVVKQLTAHRLVHQGGKHI
ncbi:hypothetical protein SDC9_147335 [bioreactor metagenome]|uniref:Uncharacterized protein n=1 Tax=bioreactor metagenome TaxID=1076179 RepID=A0A645EE18_9ZZZZ